MRMYIYRCLLYSNVNNNLSKSELSGFLCLFTFSIEFKVKKVLYSSQYPEFNRNVRSFELKAYVKGNAVCGYIRSRNLFKVEIYSDSFD